MPEFKLLAEHLAAHAFDHVSVWFPQGRRSGHEYKVGSLAGEPGNSLSINLNNGKWSDFATGDKGGDLISLFAAMRGLSQSEAATELAGGRDYGQAPRQPPRESRAERPPREAPTDPHAFAHPKHGAPTARYLYRDPAGELLYVVARYESNAGKEFAPFTWRDGRWRMKAYERPRPLYGLERLASHPRRIVIVEGEKAADALQSVLALSPVITWAGGASSWRNADWSPIKRQVLLWPDADEPGIQAMTGIASLLLTRGVPVTLVDPEGLPEGYDAADAIGQGLTGIDLNAWLRPRLKGLQTFNGKGATSVLAPEAAPEGAITVTAEPVLETTQEYISAEETPAKPRGYAVAEQFDLKLGPKGPHQNVSNLSALVGGLVASNAIAPIWWDEFLHKTLTTDGEWTEPRTLELLARIQHDYEFEKITSRMLDEAVTLHAYRARRNCAREWLTSLVWDGVERLECLMHEGFDAEDTVYTQAVGRCFVMGMAARLLMPGCQVDNLPVFEGPQGISKTRALRALGGRWYADVIEPVTTKDFYLSLNGKILVEIGEFYSFKRSESEAIRSAITRVADTYRAPYERRSSDHPRQCCFAATTNDTNWNRDPTGARRFWPIRCKIVQVGWIESNREQLFAEAAARVQKHPAGASPSDRLEGGSAWWDVPEQLARAEQRQRYDSDSFVEPLLRFAQSRQAGQFTTLDAITHGLGIEGPQRYDRALARRVEAELLHRGYQLVPGESSRAWRAPAEVAPAEPKPPAPEP